MGKMENLTIWIVALAITGIISGCGEESNSERGNSTGAPTNTNIYSGGGDVTYNNTSVADDGVYIQNGDGTITFVPGDGNSLGSDNEPSNDNRTGDYEASWSENTCKANGYFWCPISQECLNQPAQGGSCTL